MTHERVLVAELILLGFHFPNSLVGVVDDVVVVGGHRGDGRCPGVGRRVSGPSARSKVAPEPTDSCVPKSTARTHSSE